MNTNVKTIRTRSALAGLLTALALATQVVVSPVFGADTEMRGQLSVSDYKFAAAAARGGSLEVTLGKLAQDKSANDVVKQFGQHMVDQHGKAGTDLAQVASQKGATLPSGLTSSQVKQMEHLQKLTGVDFDKEYISYMVKDHKADLKEFKLASEDVKDSDLKAFAANKIPMIEEHLKMAQDIETKLNAKVVSENK